MKYLLLILFMVSLAFADYPTGISLGGGSRVKYLVAPAKVQDYLYNATGADTIIWQFPQGTEYIGFHLTVDSIAGSGITDSLIVQYRTLPDPTWGDSTAGSPFLPMTILTGTNAAPTKTSALYYNFVPSASYFLYDTTGFSVGDYIQVIIGEGLVQDTNYYSIWPVMRGGGIRW